jgi:hypothetical protein
MWDFGLRIADCGFDKAWSIEHRAWRNTAGSQHLAAGSNFLFLVKVFSCQLQAVGCNIALC